MHVVILTNQSRSLSNFWSVLLQRLHQEEHRVTCLVPSGDVEAEAALRALGADIRHYPLDRKGLNPISDIRTAYALYTILCTLRHEGADILYASTIKPVIYGLPMAALAGIPARYAMITGLGYMFEADSRIKKALTHLAAALYRTSLSFSHAVFFQNTDDINTFRLWRCLPQNAVIELTRGTGVDISRFTASSVLVQPPVFLLIGRLLEAKGLREFAEAARIVKKQYPKACFVLLGPPETGRGGIELETIRKWEAEGILDYAGETRDTRPYMEQATVIVLPSWREGLPCSLMEAMSAGRAVVATDVPGCRDVVRSGCNGFLTPVKDPAALAEALLCFCNDPALATVMGREGRALAEKEFDAIKAADRILGVMGLLQTNKTS